MSQILLIEDDDAQRATYKDILEHAGYTVLEAPDGKIGTHMYRRQPCEVVITDIYMPEQDGLETIRWLKKAYPAVKLIAVSGGGEWTTMLGNSDPTLFVGAAIGLGADYALEKPIRCEQLLHVVAEAFRGGRM